MFGIVRNFSGGFLYDLTNTKTGNKYAGESSRQPVQRFKEQKRDVEKSDASKCVARNFKDSASSNHGSEKQKS